MCTAQAMQGRRRGWFVEISSGWAGSWSFVVTSAASRWNSYVRRPYGSIGSYRRVAKETTATSGSMGDRARELTAMMGEYRVAKTSEFPLKAPGAQRRR